VLVVPSLHSLMTGRR